MLLLCHGNAPRPVASRRLRTIKAVAASWRHLGAKGCEPCSSDNTQLLFFLVVLFFFSLFSPSSPARPSGRAPSRASLTAARQPPSSLLQQLSKQLRGGSPFPGGRSPSHTCFLAPLTSQDAHRSPARTVRTAAHTEEGFPNHSTSACGAKIRGQLPADGCFRCLTWALASQALWCGVCTSSTINESGRIMRRSNENICRLAALCSLPF